MCVCVCVCVCFVVDVVVLSAYEVLSLTAAEDPQLANCQVLVLRVFAASGDWQLLVYYASIHPLREIRVTSNLTHATQLCRIVGYRSSQKLCKEGTVSTTIFAEESLSSL